MVFVFVLVLAFLTLVPWPLFRAKKTGDAVLLLGPSYAGKTAILARLTYGQFLSSHTSLQVNETQYVTEGTSGSAPLRLIDVPGHPRIRAQFREYLGGTKGIVFVVDTSTIARNGASVAEHLHIVLHAITKLPPSAHVPPILIFANKSDLISAPASSTVEIVAAERVRTILERELEKRRQSSMTGVGVGGLGETGDDGDEDGGGAVQAGLETLGDGPFTFAKWEGGEVAIVGGSVEKQTREKLEASEKAGGTTATGGLTAIESWLGGL